MSAKKRVTGCLALGAQGMWLLAQQAAVAGPATGMQRSCNGANRSVQVLFLWRKGFCFFSFSLFFILFFLYK